MKVLQRIAAARRFLASAPRPVVLVPTMGALHRGHEALIRHARRLAGKPGTVAVSIFVNPAQFGPGEDYLRYPRPFQHDRHVCAKAGANVLFHPDADEMYRPDRSVSIDEGSLSSGLCGASRPGHFRGVCTVVAKLFHIIEPKIAVFGEKDWQQLAIIRRLVRDLDFPVRIAGYPTVREEDGLAVSSRNMYLSAAERSVAPEIHAALIAASRMSAPPARLVAAARSKLSKIPGARIDYVELVDSESLVPVKNDRSRPATLAVAVFLGNTRLIDNIQLPPASS